VWKQSKGKRSRKREVLMSAMIHYKTQGKEMVIKIVRRESGSMMTVTYWAKVVSLIGMVVAKWLVGF